MMKIIFLNILIITCIAGCTKQETEPECNGGFIVNNIGHDTLKVHYWLGSIIVDAIEPGESDSLFYKDIAGQQSDVIGISASGRSTYIELNNSQCSSWTKLSIY